MANEVLKRPIKPEQQSAQEALEVLKIPAPEAGAVENGETPEVQAALESVRSAHEKAAVQEVLSPRTVDSEHSLTEAGRKEVLESLVGEGPIHEQLIKLIEEDLSQHNIHKAMDDVLNASGKHSKNP